MELDVVTLCRESSDNPSARSAGFTRGRHGWELMRSAREEADTAEPKRGRAAVVQCWAEEVGKSAGRARGRAARADVLLRLFGLSMSTCRLAAGHNAAQRAAARQNGQTGPLRESDEVCSPTANSAPASFPGGTRDSQRTVGLEKCDGARILSGSSLSLSSLPPPSPSFPSSTTQPQPQPWTSAAWWNPDWELVSSRRGGPLCGSPPPDCGPSQQPTTAKQQRARRVRRPGSDKARGALGPAGVALWPCGSVARFGDHHLNGPLSKKRFQFFAVVSLPSQGVESTLAVLTIPDPHHHHTLSDHHPPPTLDQRHDD